MHTASFKTAAYATNKVNFSEWLFATILLFLSGEKNPSVFTDQKGLASEIDQKDTASLTSPMFY